MSEQANLGGSFTLPNTSITVKRMGYGAMQLTGSNVMGPPRDMDAAVAVLREAIALGMNHLDTDDLAKQGIAYVPFFPLGGFTPLQSSALENTAKSLDATPMQVALAWLLQRSPNILLIPGTSSVEHLRQNVKAASLQLPPQAVADLKEIGAKALT